ncbi:hypothetical protein BTVI_41054 [Pitangus sulphuratus]|nr:hypothetical protein BTVI_41054 [Pitangus sulphuratus]
MFNCLADQHPEVFFCWAAFQPLFPQPVALRGVYCGQSVGLVEHHTIGFSSSVQPVQIPLPSYPPAEQHPTQLGVVCELTENALSLLVQIINKDIKEHWAQYRALGNTTCDCQLDTAPFTTTLWAQPSSQFLTQQRVHLSKPWAGSFSRRMPCETLSKPLLKYEVGVFLLHQGQARYLFTKIKFSLTRSQEAGDQSVSKGGREEERQRERQEEEEEEEEEEEMLAEQQQQQQQLT